MTITTTYPGLSINELRKKYPHHFWNQDWYKNEAFANEKAPVGTYELRIPEEGFNKKWKNQQELVQDGEGVAHPAVILNALFEHFENTGERLLETRYVRTGGRDSDGLLVCVGDFGSDGASVGGYSPDAVRAVLGVCLSRMIVGGVESEPVSVAEASSRSLEDRVTRLENTLEDVASAGRVQYALDKIEWLMAEAYQAGKDAAVDFIEKETDTVWKGKVINIYDILKAARNAD